MNYEQSLVACDLEYNIIVCHTCLPDHFFSPRTLHIIMELLLEEKIHLSATIDHMVRRDINAHYVIDETSVSDQVDT